MFKLSKWTKRAVFVGLAAFAMLFASAYLVGGAASSPLPAAATSPPLGAAASYSVLAGETVTNIGPTTMPGDLGVSPGSAVTGFPPGSVGPPGTIHKADVNAAAAQIANSSAFDGLDQGCTTTYPGIKDLVGANLVPGVYCADAFTLSGTLTLRGSGVWIFKSASTLITSGTANVVGGNAFDVWWRVVSSATLGTYTSLIGNILADTSISMATGATLNGRAFARTGSVTLDTNTIFGPICAEKQTATAVAQKTATAVAQTATAVAQTATPTTPPVVTLGRVAIVKWLDANRNGTMDAGESGMGGVVIRISSGSWSASTTTSANGTTDFAGLAPATYTVWEEVPAGYQATTPASVSVQVQANQTTEVRFGNAPPATPVPPTATPTSPAPAATPTAMAPAKLPPTGDPYGIVMVWFALGGAGAALFAFALRRIDR